MAVPIRSQKYHDPMAAKRRHRVWFVRTFGVIFALGAMSAGIYGVARLNIEVPWPRNETVDRIDEPKAVGTWCIRNECRFFDRSGAQWGQALQSSGPLLLLVEDQRASTSLQARLAVGIVAVIDVLPEMGLAAKRVVLADTQPGATIVTSKGYNLYVDVLSDGESQMGVLAIFLADKAKDPAFSPQYIDLRTPGRVYYK